MRWLAAAVVGWLALAGAGCAKRQPASQAPPMQPTREVRPMKFSLTSPAFEDGERIPARHTADGADLSPPLSWDQPPPGSAALALIMDDPDAPMGTWTHWVLYDLPPDRTALPEGVPTRDTLPDLGGAKQGLNDFRRVGYGGPAPPRGPAHHYHFRLYALDAKLGLPARASKAEVERAMRGHILGEAHLVGIYSR